MSNGTRKPVCGELTVQWRLFEIDWSVFNCKFIRWNWQISPESLMHLSASIILMDEPIMLYFNCGYHPCAWTFTYLLVAFWISTSLGFRSKALICNASLGAIDHFLTWSSLTSILLNVATHLKQNTFTQDSYHTIFSWSNW